MSTKQPWSFAQPLSFIVFAICAVFLISAETANDLGIDDTLQVSKQLPKPTCCTKEPLKFELGNVVGKFHIRWKPESFFGKNIHMLNNDVEADRIIYNRSTLDINMDFLYGRECYGYDISEFFVSMRNKFNWGDSESIMETTARRVKILDVLDGAHKHHVTRLPMWIREMWFTFSINKAFGFETRHSHSFTLGLFPFELGRGIALGTAFAVNPGVLGFYSDTTIDQFAPGFKFTGNFLSDAVMYDFYAAILENKSDNFRNTTEKVRGQEFGRANRQERGYGKIDYLIAGRMMWRPINDACNLVHLEPYILYNHAPEQRVEFIADSSSKLGTFGFAAEFIHNNFECGFDTAFNRGAQHVKGWDRNLVQFSKRDGFVVEENSQIRMGAVDGPRALFTAENQTVINASPQTAAQNGMQISTSPNLWNGENRFRDGYRNQFKGWMIVGDMSYALCDRQVKLCAAAGAASGDESPNKDLGRPNDSNVDGDFKGFVGLQEIYSGSRVKSAFVLGGAGRLPRPLTTPTSPTVLDTLPSTVSNFTNLVFVGASAEYKPRGWDRQFYLKPNILAYWQQHATKKFDITTGMTSPDQYARKYLGLEFNVFTDVELIKDLRLFCVSSVFVPGSHYTDIKGKPLNSDQQKILQRAVKNGTTANLPLIGNDTAYTINIGLDMRF